MRWLKTLLFFPVLAFALQPNAVRTEIAFVGEPIVTLKAIQQSFNAAGYRFEINALSVEEGYAEVYGRAVGIKSLNLGVIHEHLRDEGIRVESAAAERGILKLTLDAKNGVWNAPVIGSDEGVQLQKTNSPQWFRINGGQTIRIEPPYVGKWYPEIAVLDASMRVLYSFRSPKAKDQFELELPEGACYLKVSNVGGMKVLKEGMWIESVSPGR